MRDERIQVGVIAKDLITGFTGVVTSKCEWLNECCRMDLQPQSLNKDGQPIAQVAFDVEQLEYVGPGVKPGPTQKYDSRLERRVLAKDQVTGYQGLLVYQAIFLDGTVSFGVQPSELKDGEPQKVRSVASSVLEYVGPGILPAPIKEKKTGGPMDAPQRPYSVGR